VSATITTTPTTTAATCQRSRRLCLSCTTPIRASARAWPVVQRACRSNVSPLPFLHLANVQTCTHQPAANPQPAGRRLGSVIGCLILSFCERANLAFSCHPPEGRGEGRGRFLKTTRELNNS
jgi:hypothetical protein